MHHKILKSLTLTLILATVAISDSAFAIESCPAGIRFNILYKMAHLKLDSTFQWHDATWIMTYTNKNWQTPVKNHKEDEISTALSGVMPPRVYRGSDKKEYLSCTYDVNIGKHSSRQPNYNTTVGTMTFSTSLTDPA